MPRTPRIPIACAHQNKICSCDIPHDIHCYKCDEEMGRLNEHYTHFEGHRFEEKISDGWKACQCGIAVSDEFWQKIVDNNIVI